MNEPSVAVMWLSIIAISTYLIIKVVTRFVLRYRIRNQHGRYYPEVREGFKWRSIVAVNGHGKVEGDVVCEYFNEACDVIEQHRKSTAKPVYYYP